MRKLRIVCLAVAGLLALTAIAFAAQTNTYTVSGGVKPTKIGTKKKPTPVLLNFDYTVGEQAGQRPALINQYDIFFENGQVNTAFFPSCPAAKIDQDQTDANCAKGSLMGSGNVENAAGPTSDPSNKALSCHLDLKIYNAGKQHAALYLKGGPNDPRGAAKSCPLEVNKAIDATFVKRATGTSLVFDVDETLLHPAPGFDNAVIQVNSTIRKATVKKAGKTRGFFESAGKCRNGKSGIKVTFRQVDGTKATVSTAGKCT
ncbi:MAG: hypothetical protein JWR35_3748 [Marmoricola sp.]|nr:hypothetical protein [Marmoricola sp.]